jgi:hypothetical protein
MVPFSYMMYVVNGGTPALAVFAVLLMNFASSENWVSGRMSTVTSGKPETSGVVLPLLSTTCHPDVSSTYVCVSSWSVGHVSVRISEMDRVLCLP